MCIAVLNRQHNHAKNLSNDSDMPSIRSAVAEYNEAKCHEFTDVKHGQKT